MPNSFHNTAGLHGPALKRAERKAKGQEGRILRFFQEHPHPKGYAPSEVLRFVWGHERQKPPITSIRRAMTNLSNPDKYFPPKLEKTSRLHGSPHGGFEHCWQLVPTGDTRQGELF